MIHCSQTCSLWVGILQKVVKVFLGQPSLPQADLPSGTREGWDMGRNSSYWGSCSLRFEA